MKNADMPAMPTHDVFEHCGFDGNSGPHMTQTTNYGLTKREEFSRSAMNAILANQSMIDQISSNSVNWLVESSVMVADSLLAELDRTCQKY